MISVGHNISVHKEGNDEKLRNWGGSAGGKSCGSDIAVPFFETT